MAQTLSRIDLYSSLQRFRHRFVDATCHIDSETRVVETSLRNAFVRFLWRLFGLKRSAILVVPTTDFLIKRLKVPKSAQASLESIVHLTIEKATPFRPADVYWSVHNVKRDSDDGRIRAELVLLTRRRIAASLEAVREQALLPLAVQSDDGAYTARLQNQALSWRRPAFAAATLIVAVAAVPLVSQEHEIARLEAKVAALAQSTEMAPRRADDGRGAIWSAHLAEQTQLGVPIALLSEVTERLPDDTYIDYYRQHDGVVEIRGRTPRATSLAAGLARSAILQNVRLGAPTSDADHPLQKFVLIADVAQVSQ